MIPILVSHQAAVNLFITCPVGLGGCSRNPSLNYITMVIFRFGVQMFIFVYTYVLQNEMVISLLK